LLPQLLSPKETTDKPQNFANIGKTAEEPVKASPKMAPEAKKPSSSSVGRKTGIIMTKKQEDNSLDKKLESNSSEVNLEQKSADKPLETSVKKGGVLAAASMFKEKAEEVAKSHESLTAKPPKSVLHSELKVEKSSTVLAAASKFEEKIDEAKPVEQKPKEEKPKPVVAEQVKLDETKQPKEVAPKEEISKPVVTEQVKLDEIKPVATLPKEVVSKEETKPTDLPKESPKSTDSKPKSPKSKDNNSKPTRTKKENSKKNITKKDEKKPEKPKNKVLAILEELDLKLYYEKFKAQDVDYHVLLELTDKDLKDLGLTDEAVTKIRTKIKEIKRERRKKKI